MRSQKHELLPSDLRGRVATSQHLQTWSGSAGGSPAYRVSANLLPERGAASTPGFLLIQAFSARFLRKHLFLSCAFNDLTFINGDTTLKQKPSSHCA